MPLYALRNDVESSSVELAVFCRKAWAVKSSPLQNGQQRSQRHAQTANLPYEPQETFGRGVLLGLQFIHHEGLQVCRICRSR